MRTFDFASGVNDLLTVGELESPDAASRELFERLFKAPIPDFPRHVVARYGADQALAGYVHFTPMADFYLCGGMGLDARLYRRMPAAHRERIGAAGGVAEIMLRASFANLRDRDAIFGYCGDARAMRVDLRAGFERLDHPYLIVHWTRRLPADVQAGRVAAAHALGPF
ncbi:MAG: hypothetical protein JNK75_15065 [Betaproteobacteria bacterium]|nr:hypothetical protein [Betaproteobacteria bacterium]